MADDSLTATYSGNRRTADRAELDAWLATEAAKPPEPEAPAAVTPAKKEKPGVLAAGFGAAKETFLEGASNFFQGIARRHESMGDFKPEGQQLLGVLQVLSALPAGAGAAVQAALGKYTPGLEAAEAIPGGKAGEVTAAGIVRSVLSAPSLVLDPKMREAIAKNPEPLAAALNEPMTYGELANILAQFATPAAMKKGGQLIRARRGGAAEPAAITPEVLQAEPVGRGLALPRGGEVIEGEVVPKGALPQSTMRALPERGTPEPIVTPPPGASSSIETRIRAAQAQGPEAYARMVAEELQQLLEQAPAPSFQETIVERYGGRRAFESEAPLEVPGAEPAAPGELVSPQGRPVKAEPGTMPERERLRALERTRISEPSAVTAPEGAPPVPMAGGLSSALERSLQRSEQILGEELGAIRERAGRTKALAEVSRQAEAEALEQARAGLKAAEMRPTPTPEGEAKPAPVTFRGLQELPASRGGGHWELWNLTEDIPGHPKGSTMTRQTLERMGYQVPEAPAGAEVPKPKGLEALKPGAPEAPRGLAGLGADEIDAVMGTLDMMWTELKEAAPGERFLLTEETGKVTGGLRQPSTYPDFMTEVIGKKTRQHADELMAIIDDIHAGKVDNPVAERLIDFARRNWERYAGSFGGFGEGGQIDTGMLARMGLGAALGGSQGDTAEERIRNAFLGIGLGAMVSRRLAQRLTDAYRQSGLADETGAINVNAFRPKPSVQAGEKPFQPNYQRIEATPAVKATMKNIHRLMKDDILARRGPARSNDLRVQEALQLIDQEKMTPERVLTLGDREMLTDTEMTAARILTFRAFEYATDVKAQVLKGEPVPEGTLRESLAIAGAMGRNTRVAQTRIAQAQQASAIKVSGERVGYRPEDVAQLADEMLPGMTDKQIATLMGAATSVEMGRAATFWSLFPRMALEGMYFSYLSGKAAFRNVVGNLTMMAIAPVVRGIARFMPRWGSEKPGVVPGEATQMARALGDSLIDYVRMIRHTDQMDTAAGRLGISSTMGKSEARLPALTAENLSGMGVPDSLATLGGWMGEVFRFPGVVLDRTDLASKGINGTMALRVEAFRQATFEGKTDAAFEARINELMNDVTKLNQTSRQRVVDFADEQTFTKDFEGRLLRGLAAGPENEWLNLVYRGAILPFFRVVARMTEQTMAHSPGLNFAAKQFWEDWNAGGARRQVAQARVVAGAAVIGSFIYLESQGMMTGNAPKDPKLRAMWNAAGYQERSWWDPVSEKWRSYDGLGPLTSLIAGAADTSMTLRKLPAESQNAMHYFYAFLMSQIDSLDSRTFTQSISNFIDMVKTPSNDTRAEQGMTFLRKQIAGWLKPGLVREIETMVDPEVRRVIRSGAKESGLDQEFQALLDEVRAGWPGFSSAKDAYGNYLVPPARDPISGEPTIIESWPFNPFPGRTPKVDYPVRKPDGTMTDVRKEILRLNGAGLDELPDWIGGSRPAADVGMTAENLRGGLRLTPQEKDRWAELMTQGVTPMGGLTYGKALQAEMQTEHYWAQSDGQRGTDGGKAARLQMIERAYREQAEEQLKKDSPKLEQAIKQRQGERLINKAPTAQQPGLRQMFEGILNR
jgi:hypothetical protein